MYAFIFSKLLNGYRTFFKTLNWCVHTHICTRVCVLNKGVHKGHRQLLCGRYIMYKSFRKFLLS